MKSSSPATNRPQWRQSPTALRAERDAAGELAELFEKLGALFGRWDELNAEEKERVKAVFIEKFLPALPEEFLAEMDAFFESRDDWRKRADDAEGK